MVVFVPILLASPYCGLPILIVTDVVLGVDDRYTGAEGLPAATKFKDCLLDVFVEVLLFV